jgi:hypothetical protein
MRTSVVALLLLSACTAAPAFSVDEVTPTEVRSDIGGALRVRGQFPALVKIDFERPDASSRSAEFQAQVQQDRTIRLLDEVVLIDATTLVVVVPGGLAPGAWALEVTDPRGRRSRLEAAFMVLDCALSSVCPGSCADNNGGCSVDATCDAAQGVRTCACKPGFVGDGVVCDDVDECTKNNGGCSANATCMNLPGSSACTCQPGFVGDGVTCDDVDECTKNNGGCSANATCTNAPGGFSCVCGAGYAGDGGVCLWTSSALAGLAVSPGQVTFIPSVTTYAVTVPAGTMSLAVTPTVANPAGVTITVQGLAATSGAATAVPLTALPVTIEVRVLAETGASEIWYLIVTGPTTPATYVKDLALSANDRLGVPLALSADGSTLVVGAPGEDGQFPGVEPPVNESFANSGAVVVLVRSGNVWVPQARIKASNVDVGDAFGTAVALSASGDTLVVGAPAEDSGAVGVGGAQGSNSLSGSGAVYVFVRTGGIWAQQAYVKASNTDSGDAFGTTVALSSDGSTLAVGAPGEASKSVGVNGSQSDNTAPGSGAVYVFQRAAGVWTQDAYLKASNTDSGDAFGSSLALGSAGTRLVVGAPGEDSNAMGVDGASTSNAALGSGAAYAFHRASAWSQVGYLKASNTDPGDAFGAAVAISTDGTIVAVGAPGEASSTTGAGGSPNNAAVGSGAVYVFGVTSALTCFQRSYVKASNTGPGDAFGSSVALSADGSALAVGAPGEDSGATGLNGNQLDNGAGNSGAVYVFMRRASSSVLVQQAWVKAGNTDAFDEFGAAVALSGDGSVLAAGAPGEAGTPGTPASNAAPNSGAAYVFTR